MKCQTCLSELGEQFVMGVVWVVKGCYGNYTLVIIIGWDSMSVFTENAIDPFRRRAFAGYSRHFWSAEIPKDYWNDLAWVHR